VFPGIGNGVEPVPELNVHAVEIAERTGEEKVLRIYRNGRSTLPFVLARRALHTLGWNPWWRINESTLIDDAICLTFADDRSLHPVIKHFPRGAADTSKAAMWQRRTVGRF